MIFFLSRCYKIPRIYGISSSKGWSEVLKGCIPLEVASLVLESIGEQENADLLGLFFATFKENYLLGKSRQQLTEESSQHTLIQALTHL